MEFFKRIIKYVYYNYFYKNKVKIHFNSNTDFKTSYGMNCHLKKYCRVSKSILGDNIILNNGATLKESSISNYVSLHNNAIVSFCQIDSYTYIAKNSIIYNATIGKFCSVGPDVWIGLGKHPTNFLSTSPLFYSNLNVQLGFSFTTIQMFDEFKNCIIGNDVWIGAKVMILDGVKIGDGAIVAANSVVTKDVEPYSIVGGNPAKHIKYRFSDEKIREIKALNWWNWTEEKIKKELSLFQKEV